MSIYCIWHIWYIYLISINYNYHPVFQPVLFMNKDWLRCPVEGWIPSLEFWQWKFMYLKLSCKSVMQFILKMKIIKQSCLDKINLFQHICIWFHRTMVCVVGLIRFCVVFCLFNISACIRDFHFMYGEIHICNSTRIG